MIRRSASIQYQAKVITLQHENKQNHSHCDLCLFPEHADTCSVQYNWHYKQHAYKDSKSAKVQ